MLVISIFSFSHNVMKEKKKKIQGYQKLQLCGKGFNVAEMAKFVFDKVEYIMGNREKTGHQHFLSMF